MALSTLFRNFGRKLQQSFPIILRAPKPVTYIAGIGSVASYKAHLAYVGSGAAQSVGQRAHFKDQFTRSAAMREAAGNAIGKQTAIALHVLRMRGEAERANIRAKFGVKLAQLKLHQAVRDYGATSAVAVGARADLREARRDAIIAGTVLSQHGNVF